MAVSATVLDDAAAAEHAAATGGVAASSRKVLRRRWTSNVDRAIGAIVDPATAILIVAEVVILSSGVFSRYVLKSALVWTDELATILFLWLAMLGAVAAYRRGEHMRLTALVRRVPPAVARAFETISSTIVGVFALELLYAIVWPATAPANTGGFGGLLASMARGTFFAASYLAQETVDFTPALNIPRSDVVLAIVVSLVLILVLAVLRLIDSDPRVVIPVVAATAVISALAWVERGALVPLGNANLFLFFVVLVGACVAIGVPIAFAFGTATMSYLALVTSVPLSTVAGRMDEGISNLVLLAIPLFILLGLLIECAGIAKRLVNAIASLVGHLRGGLNIVLVAAMYLVSGISGSKVADMAAVAPVLFPEMERRGGRRSEMIALLATSGAMAETIPPSLVLIIIGTVASVSIQQLFTAGLLPAAVASIALLAVALVRSRRDDRTELAARPSVQHISRAIFVALPGLVLPLLIRYCVVGGIATATEVSTVGILYSLVVGLLIYREFDWRRAYPMLRETAGLTGAILLIISTATAMGWALTQSGFANQLAQSLEHAPGGAGGFMALSIVLFIVLGSVLEGIPAMVLFGPLLFPIATQLGINEVHYAIVAVLAMGIGLFAPPFGLGYYGACAVGRCDPDEAAVRIVPYLLALVVALIIVAAVPWISTGFLPAAR